MTDNIRPALYQAKYHAILANKADAIPEETVTIAGKCRESGDLLIQDICLAASHVAINSASVEDSATVFCALEFHDTIDPAMSIPYPVTDLRVSLSAAQSEST